MAKHASTLELSLNERPARAYLGRWLHGELRNSILDGRLRPGDRLPATREFAQQYGLSRGTVVSVFERLQSEGYLLAQVGAGTCVNPTLPGNLMRPGKAPEKSVAAPRTQALSGIPHPQPARPFRLQEPALNDFPLKEWARIASRRLRRARSSMLAGGGIAGYAPLREAIAGYLRTSRGVQCEPEQIMIFSGVQQALDLLARFLFKPGERVWLEDPGYFGALHAFRNAGVKIVPVPVDEFGLRITPGLPRAAGAYLTPAHQFPLGMTMSLERRLKVLDWAKSTGAYILEDDYDSEYRFEGHPVGALQSLDQAGTVIYIGTFNKLLFPAVRTGYAVLPPRLIDRFRTFRFATELQVCSLDQAVLTDFIQEGHLGRHIRRTRELYGERLQVLLDHGQRALGGLMRISPVRAGLYTAAFLTEHTRLTSQEAEAVALEAGVETLGLGRFAIRRPDARGLLLGFAAFREEQIRSGLTALAAALDRPARSKA